MNALYWVIIFSFFSVCSFTQSIRLIIFADDQPALGASIYINGKVKAIADEQGKAQLANINNGDTIQVSYLGYKQEKIVFSKQHKELNIHLVQDTFFIGEVVVSPKNDMSLFKKMLKWGLQVATIYKGTSFCLTDTLQFFSDTCRIYRQCTGKLIMRRIGHVDIVRKVQTELLDSTPDACRNDYLSRYEDGKENDLFGKYKIPIRDIHLCFFDPYYLSSFDRDLRLTYLGKDSIGYDHFYFSVTNDSWALSEYSKSKVHFGGIVYLNSDGVIEKIRKHKTSLDISVESYEFDIDYVYDKKNNEVIPFQAFLHTYRLNEELEVILARSAHLEIYSKQALTARVITPE
jgi:hypothetical protein